MPEGLGQSKPPPNKRKREMTKTLEKKTINEQEELDRAEREGKKYVLYKKVGNLWQIRACRDILVTASKGDLGGFIQTEENLSQEGMSWVSQNAKVWGNARVSDDAKVWGNARVYGNAKVSGIATVSENGEVCGNATISDAGEVRGDTNVSGDAKVGGNAKVCGNARICGNAEIGGNAIVKSKVLEGKIN